MSKLVWLLVLVGLVSLAVAVPVMAAPGAPGKDGLGKGLAEVRQATVAFHDVAAAEAAGYVSTVECVAVPGLGGMGFHYANFALVDATISATEPEVLLYAPQPTGGVKLVAVEYLSVVPGEVLGQELHEPGPPGPPFFSLHAWIWQANPAGVFTDFNPNISCPEE